MTTRRQKELLLLRSRNANVTSLAATLAVAALTTANAAHAQTFYESLAAFNAAATTTNNAFEGIAPDGGSANNPAVLTTPAPGRVTFAITGGNDVRVFAADSAGYGGAAQLSDGTDSVLAGLPSFSASTTRISLGNAYTAFGIEYKMESNFSNSYTFGLFSGETPVGTTFVRSSIGGANIFGAVSDTAFDNVRVTAAPIFNSAYVLFDNARVGSASAVAVPEAGSLALLLPALGVLGIVVRRKVRLNKAQRPVSENAPGNPRGLPGAFSPTLSTGRCPTCTVPLA